MHSTHFSERELSCKCCGENRSTEELLNLAEGCRAILNTPLIVHCSTRCEKHNKEVGGEADSKHLKGIAMDFHARGIAHVVVFKTLVAWAEAGRLPQLGGIGLYDWGVHVDCYHAKDGHLRKWDYRTELG